MKKIKVIKKKIKEGKLNPYKAKALLAKEIVRMCHSLEKAITAEKEFANVFQKGKIPSNIEKIKMAEKDISILDLLLNLKMISSKAEGRRTIEQKGVKVNNETKSDWQESILIKKGMIISIGKRKFVQII